MDVNGALGATGLITLVVAVFFGVVASFAFEDKKTVIGFILLTLTGLSLGATLVMWIMAIWIGVNV